MGATRRGGLILVRLLSFVLVLALALFGLGIMPVSAQTDLMALYKQILQNPQNTELNLRYARAAEEQGQVQRAIAALERVIANDPQNETARNEIGRLRGLVAQPETHYSVTVGALFETNMPRQNDRFDEFHDWGMYASGTVEHQRTIGGQRYLFDGQIYTRYNNRWNEGALDFIGGQAAPIYYGFGGWRITPGLGVAYARLDRDPYFGSLYAFVNFDATDEGVFRQIRFRGGYDKYDNANGLRSGMIMATDATFAWTELWRPGDTIILRPEFTLDRARSSNNQFYDATLRTLYATPLPNVKIPHVDGGVTGVVYLNATLRGYERQAGLASPGRDDRKFNPGVQMIFKDVYRPGFSVTAGYGYEVNLSRSFVNEYKNHTVMVSGTWRF